MTEYSCSCSKDEALELSSETDFSKLITNTRPFHDKSHKRCRFWQGDAENSACNSARQGCRSGSSLTLHINTIQLK